MAKGIRRFGVKPDFMPGLLNLTERGEDYGCDGFLSVRAKLWRMTCWHQSGVGRKTNQELSRCIPSGDTSKKQSVCKPVCVSKKGFGGNMVPTEKTR